MHYSNAVCKAVGCSVPQQVDLMMGRGECEHIGTSEFGVVPCTLNADEYCGVAVIDPKECPNAVRCDRCEHALDLPCHENCPYFWAHVGYAMGLEAMKGRPMTPEQVAAFTGQQVFTER